MENRTSCTATPFWTIRTNGVIEFELNNGERDFPVNAGGNVVDGNFHHIAVVRQGFHLGVFFDGTKVGNGATGDTEISVGDPGVFHVGTSVCTGLDGTANFTGQLDEIQIYNGIALDDGEIRVLYESGHEGMCK
ncbi:MAG: LamG-like jellyroll fold domain-containing protein [Bryobacteraceae bacterium]